MHTYGYVQLRIGADPALWLTHLELENIITMGQLNIGGVMKQVTQAFLDGCFTMEGISEEKKDLLLRGVYKRVKNSDLKSWERIKQVCRDSGYTHLPNGDDL